MKLELVNKNFEIESKVSIYSFLQYEHSYNDISKLSLKVPLDLFGYNVDMFLNHFLLVTDDDILERPLLFEIITNTVTDSEEDEKDIIDVKAESIKRWLEYRVIDKQKVYQGTTISISEQLINEHLINPEDPERKINDLEIKTARTVKMLESQEIELLGSDVFKEIKKLLDLDQMGFDIFPVVGKQKLPEGGEVKKILDFEFMIYSGDDKTLDGQDPVTLSIELKNLRTIDHQIDIDTEKTTAIVYGEEIKNEAGEVTGRYSTVVGTGLTGINRKEIFKDSKQTKREEEQTQEQYEAILNTVGRETIELNRATETISTTVNQESTIFRIKDNYNVGDKVTVKIEKTNRRMDAVITKVVVTEDEAEKIVDLSLGYPRISELKKIALEGSI